MLDSGLDINASLGPLDISVVSGVLEMLTDCVNSAINPPSCGL